MLGDKDSKTFLRELYVRWQPRPREDGSRRGLLAGSEQLTELVRAKQDDLVLFAQKGVKSEEKKASMSKFMSECMAITFGCVLGCGWARPSSCSPILPGTGNLTR